jgi:hypothetical protein
MFGLFGYSKPETERHSWVVSLTPNVNDSWKYKYENQPDFVKRKVGRVMSANLGMSWRDAVDLIYARRRKAIERATRKARITASRAIDPR